MSEPEAKPGCMETVLVYGFVGGVYLWMSALGAWAAVLAWVAGPAPGGPQQIARWLVFSAGISFFVGVQWIAWIRRLLPGAAEVGWAFVLLAISLYFVAQPFAEGLPIAYSAIMFFLAGPLVVASIAWGTWMAYGGELSMRFRRVAEDLQLGPARKRLFRVPTTEGEVDGVPIRLSVGEEGAPRIEVRCSGAPEDLLLEREGASVGQALFREQVRTGDLDFDREVFVRGDEVIAIGTLDASTRAAIREATHGGAALRERVLRVTLSRDARSSDIVHVARNLVRVAQGLRQPTGRLAGLIRAAREDADPLVRVRAVALLRASTDPDPARTVALNGALEDPDPRVRAVAAGEPLEGGELSVAAPSAGGVSLAGTTGAVSLPPKRS